MYSLQKHHQIYKPSYLPHHPAPLFLNPIPDQPYNSYPSTSTTPKSNTPFFSDTPTSLTPPASPTPPTSLTPPTSPSPPQWLWNTSWMATLQAHGKFSRGHGTWRRLWNWLGVDWGRYRALHCSLHWVLVVSSWSNQNQPWRFLQSFVHITYVHHYGWRNKQICTEKNSER